MFIFFVFGFRLNRRICAQIIHSQPPDPQSDIASSSNATELLTFLVWARLSLTFWVMLNELSLNGMMFKKKYRRNLDV